MAENYDRGALIHKKTRFPLQIILPNFLILIALYLVSVTCPTQITLLFYLFAQIVLCLSHFFHLRSKSNLDILDAQNMVNVGFFLHLGLAPSLLFYDVLPSRYDDIWNIENFPNALVLTQASLLMIHFGYYLDWFGRSAKPLFYQREVAEKRLVIFTLLIISVPILMQIAPEYFMLGGFTVMVVTQLIYLPFLLILLYTPGSRVVTKVVVIIGILWAFNYSLFWGITSKAGVAAPFCALILLYHYFHKRLGIIFSVSALVLMIILVTYMNYTRGVGYIANLSWDVLNPFSFQNIETYRVAGISALLTPFEGLLSVLNTVPEVIPFQNGQRLFEEMIYPLFPRVLFDFKPIVYGSNVFWEIHRGFITGETPNFESISFPGYFYLDFGVLGILGGGLLFGILTRAIYRRLILQGVSRGSVCIYGYVCALEIVSARTFVWTTQTILINLLTPFIIISLLYTKSSKGIKDGIQ